MERDHAIPPFLWKAAITLAVGGAAYLITNATGQPEIWRLTISIFIGGSTLIIQYMADFDRRLNGVESSLERHAKDMKSLVDRRYSKISEATKLFSLVENSPLHTESVVQLVSSAAKIKAEGPDIVATIAQSEITRVGMLMEGLDAGEAVYDGEDHDWLLALTQSTAGSIDATSTSVDVNFWTTELGRRYLAAQREAIKRGVRVRRLFIVDHPDLVDDDAVRELRVSHADLGVEVRVLLMSTLSQTLKLDTMFDFIIFDDAVSYEVSAEQALEPVIANTRLVLRDTRVARRVQRFNDLWEAGSVTGHQLD
ncbi:DUF6879 family protein [Streptomyces sp. NPDC050617]|uniref:DUF6879 family protein n=1 Tax=Streptomyces sp. NPDC050617 TaxID=3154628 RepID=UPI0034419D7A